MIENNPNFFLLSRGVMKNNSYRQNEEVMSDKRHSSLPDIGFTAKCHLHSDINWFTSKRARSAYFPL